MRWAHVIDEVVINILLWDGETEFEVAEGELVLIPDDIPVDFGWNYYDSTFLDNRPVPIVELPDI